MQASAPSRISWNATCRDDCPIVLDPRQPIDHPGTARQRKPPWKGSYQGGEFIPLGVQHRQPSNKQLPSEVM